MGFSGHVLSSPSPHVTVMRGDPGGLLKDSAQKWEELIEELLVLATASRPSELEFANFHPKLGALNLVQPFNWKAWGEPFPEPEQAKLLDLENAVKQITRICRADRFMEGTLWATVCSGLLLGLCLVVREHTRGEIAPNVMIKAS